MIPIKLYKKTFYYKKVFFCVAGGTRTLDPVWAGDFKSPVYTNSTTATCYICATVSYYAQLFNDCPLSMHDLSPNRPLTVLANKNYML